MISIPHHRDRDISSCGARSLQWGSKEPSKKWQSLLSLAFKCNENEMKYFHSGFIIDLHFSTMELKFLNDLAVRFEYQFCIYCSRGVDLHNRRRELTPGDAARHHQVSPRCGSAAQRSGGDRPPTTDRPATDRRPTGDRPTTDRRRALVSTFQFL